MSRRENGWYLIGAMTDALRRRPDRRTLAIGLVAGLLGGLAAAIVVAADTLTGGSSPVGVAVLAGGLVALTIGGSLLWARERVRRARDAYLRGLQSPEPGALIAEVDGTFRSAAAVPDADAFRAQARALAYALYGRAREAHRVLAEVTWRGRAPLVQAVGLSAEGIVALLCERDPARALAHAKRARALASVRPAFPGAGQAARYHDTCVAACEAVLGAASAEGLRLLEEEAEDPRFPTRQLLAAFARATAAERSGDAALTERLRGLVASLAPHCAPLQLRPAELAESSRAEPGAGAPSAAVEAPDEPGVQERTARRKLARWALLLILFAALWNVFSRRG